MMFFNNFLLRYSGGVSLDILRDDLENVVASFEQSARYERELANDPRFPPLRFGELAHYEQTMQLISLCYLLHRRDLLQRIADLFDGAYAAKDTLYEDLLAYELYNRFEVDRWYHDKPYRDLINSLYRETPGESVVDIKKYLEEWYRSMENTPWHDGHLRMSKGGGGGYFGYWAIEAAAVAYLLQLDDASFRENIVYPQDLVDYAREFDNKLEGVSEGGTDNSLLRTPAGDPCPKTGFWFTPAQPDSRRFFTVGQVMPAFSGSEYGATIWQWSEEQ